MSFPLNQIRRSQNLSQKQLAEMVGLKSKSSISQLEHGHQKGSIELWEAIAKALGCPLSDLREQCNE